MSNRPTSLSRVHPLLGRVALGAQRPIVVKLSRGRSVGRSVQCMWPILVEFRSVNSEIKRRKKKEEEEERKKERIRGKI